MPLEGLKMRAHKILAGVIAAGVGAVALSAATGAVAGPTAISYTIDLPNYAVSDIDEVELGSPFTFVGQGDYPGDPAFSASSPGPTTLTYSVPTDLYPGFSYTIGQAFLLGVATDLSGDAPGQQHLVLFTNDSFAAAAQGVAFGTLFPNTNETALNNDLETQTNPGDIFTFAGGDAVNGPGSVASITFEPGQNFEAVAFSNGQIIGSGTSELIGAAPEPAAWALMMLGIGSAGLALRGRRRTDCRSAAVA